MSAFAHGASWFLAWMHRLSPHTGHTIIRVISAAIKPHAMCVPSPLSLRHCLHWHTSLNSDAAPVGFASFISDSIIITPAERHLSFPR
jgi:hypothetical protein